MSINQNKTDNFFNRWKSPSERSMYELRNPNPDSLDDKYNLQAFKAEITVRYAIPINVVTFSMLVVCFLLSFKFDRVDNISKILKIFGLIIFLQVISITSSNLSIKFDGMHYINFIPSIFCLICSCLIIFKSKRLVNGDK